MRITTLIGLVLVALGIIALAYQGITYQDRETVLDIGPVKATTETEKTIPLPPIVGGLAVVSGVIIILAGKRRI